MKNASNQGHEHQELLKNIGFFDAMMMVVGIVIGSGIFFKTSTVLKLSGSPTMSILAWVLGGVIAMASALTISEMATAIPKTGGLFVYLRELFGEKTAFLFGWVQSAIYNPGVTAALSIIVVTQAKFFFNLSPLEEKLIAMGLILFITAINVFSTKVGSKVQTVATIGKLIPIISIIGFGLIKGGASSESVSVVAETSTLPTFTLAGFGAAILGTLWAYDGWVGVTNIAGEVKHAQKNLPRAIIIGLTFIIGVYITINLAILKVLPIEAVAATQTPASDAAVVLFGEGGAAFITIGIMVSIFGAMNGYMLTGVRVPYAMAKEGLYPFPKVFGELSKFDTPMNAFIIQAVLACIYVVSGSFEILTNLSMFMVWVFFTITVSGIFILRRRKDLVSTYKVPFYPIVPLVGIIGGLYICISTIIENPLFAVIGIGVTLLGLPAYYWVKKKA